MVDPVEDSGGGDEQDAKTQEQRRGHPEHDTRQREHGQQGASKRESGDQASHPGPAEQEAQDGLGSGQQGAQNQPYLEQADLAHQHHMAKEIQRLVNGLG